MKGRTFNYEKVLSNATKAAAALEPFRQWERRFNDFPFTALSILDSAISYRRSRLPSEITNKYLDAAISVAERVVAEDRFAQAPNENDQYLVANGKHKSYRVLAVGCALRDGTWPDRALVEKVVENQVKATRELSGKGGWDIEQSIYLTAVELALVAGNPDEAMAMLSKRYSFRQSLPRYEGLLYLCQGILGKTTAKTPSNPFQAYEEFFEKRRYLAYGPYPDGTPHEWTVYDDTHVQVLQMAMIKHAYIDGKGLSSDWQRVFHLLDD